jgi:RNA polymerase sigma-70 factor (ECF subfamily)
MEASDESIYDKHRDDLIRFAAAIVGPDRAEDVLSGVIVRCLAGGGLMRLAEPRPYLFKAVLNESRSVLRRSRAVPLPDSLGVSDSSDVEVIDAVMRLPARQRAAVYLVYWQGESISDAAQLMGSKPGTLKRYLHLARRRLRGALS